MVWGGGDWWHGLGGERCNSFSEYANRTAKEKVLILALDEECYADLYLNKKNKKVQRIHNIILLPCEHNSDHSLYYRCRYHSSFISSPLVQ